MMRSWKAIGGFFLAGILAVPTWANTGLNANPPQPGTLNYIEGQASIGSQALDSKSVGSAELQAGQVLATQNGKAEILLTPGVFLRIDNNSVVRMDSPGLADTTLTLQQGRALVEVAEIRKENDISIRVNGVSVRLLKKGLYEFSASTNEIRVFDGKAEVMSGDRNIEIGGGHALAFNDPQMKTHGFDKKASEDEFYRWASLRSSYLAEANVDAARIYMAGGSGWYGPGWYWDPWFTSYTWIPGAGILWSPFGWGFYSPFEVYSAPYFRYYGGYRHFGPGYRAPAFAARSGAGFAPHGFEGGGMRGGGGFHGGAGGGSHGGGGHR
jgi:hypothetical protein